MAAVGDEWDCWATVVGDGLVVGDVGMVMWVDIVFVLDSCVVLVLISDIVPKLKTAEDLQGDALLHYDAEKELMNLILLSILNDIYISVDACTSAKDMWKRFERLMRGTIQNKVERETRFTNEFDQFVAELGEALVSVYNHFVQLMNYLERNDMHFPINKVNVSIAKKLKKLNDPIGLVAHTSSSSRNTSSYYVTHPTSIVDHEDEYQQDDVQTNSEDPLASAMLLLTRAITQKFSTPTNNRNTSTVQCYNYSGKGHYARNCPKPRVRDSKYFMEQMLLAKQDEAGVILTDEQNDFLFADASRMEEIEELSANICLMAIIQPADNTSDAGPSYDSAFISEVQSSSNNENEEQMYPTHTKIINSTIGDDQIDSDIIFEFNCTWGKLKVARDIKEMKDVFESTKSKLCELEKQNDFLKDQLLEVSLKHEVELSVLLNHECVDNSLHAEIEQLKKKSIEIQEGLQTRIKILEKDVQRCEKQSVDFELKLQHEKEKHKWDSNLKNKNTNPLDYSWISKMEKLEDENVSLDFTVQSLIKERDNVKLEYQKLFNSIKKTRSQTQTEMDELIAHVSEKTYAYGAIRAENQNLLFTISELKTRLANVEKGSTDRSEDCLEHNIFSIGQFCDGDLEVAFRSKTCYVRNLEGDDLLTGDRE
ncbi:integrase, catalytic region, zinc finger, CCHC-type containing protein [Tanacetum coccineum]